MTYSQAGIVSRATLYIILGASVFLAAAFMLLPKGFSDDASKIGQGKSAVVLVHDKSSMRSLDIMTMLNKVRGDYASKIDFIVVNISSKEGQLFRQQQNVNAFALIFFNPKGARLGLLVNNMDESKLRLELDKISH